MKIGFIGLGKMGSPMAHNLLKAGNELTVYDVMPDAVKALCDEGASSAASIKSAAAGMDVVITMVQTGKQVSDICLGDQGLFQHIPRTALYLDCSSIDIVNTKTLHADAKKYRVGDAGCSCLRWCGWSNSRHTNYYGRWRRSSI